jgi:hypothetical protein
MNLIELYSDLPDVLSNIVHQYLPASIIYDSDGKNKKLLRNEDFYSDEIHTDTKLTRMHIINWIVNQTSNFR